MSKKHSDFADSGRRIGLAFAITTILFMVASVLTLRFIRQLPETIRQLHGRGLSSRFELLHMVSRAFIILGFLSMATSIYLLVETREREIVNDGFREPGTYDPMDPNIYPTHTYTNQVDHPLTAPLFGFGWVCLMAAAGTSVYIRFSAQYSRLRAKFPANGINIYKIKPPRNVEYRPDNIHEFVKGLAASFPALLLQIRGNHEGVTWRVVDSLGIYVPNLLEQHIRNTFPDAEIEVVAYQPAPPSEVYYRYLSQYKLVTDFILPMQYIEDFKYQDPLSVIVEALGHIQKGEQVTYSVALFGEAPDAYRKGLRMITRSTFNPFQLLFRNGLQQAAGAVITDNTRAEKYHARDQRVLEDKLRDVLYYGQVIVQADSYDPERLHELVALVETQMPQFAKSPYNGLAQVGQNKIITINSEETDFRFNTIGHHNALADTYVIRRSPLLTVFSTRELAALWHLPTNKVVGTNVEYVNSVVKVPSKMARQADTTLESDEHPDRVYIGTGRYQNREVPIVVSLEDRRLHTNIVGKTGTGKSNLMHHLIHQDIASGRGVAVIDPHGTLIRAILETSIPEARMDDVVLLDLANLDFPPPINPMRGNFGRVGIGRIMSIFERLYDDVDQYVRLAKYLQAAVGLLAEDNMATMRDISRVFIDDTYRHRLLNQTDNAFVMDVWEIYETQSDAQRRQIHEPILSRIAPFYGNPVLYPILCHPQVLNFRQFITEKKIVLVSLAISDDLVSDRERNLIGALVVSMLQMAGMQEEKERQGDIEPFYVYVDEVQKFVTTSLDVVLSEARKYGLSLTIANQFLGQLHGKTLDAVMGNVGTTIVFRPSPEDARAIATHMSPQFKVEDIVNLDLYTAAIKLQNEGATQPAFTLYTPPPLEKPKDAQGRAKHITRRAIKNTKLKSKAEVLEWLNTRYPRRNFGQAEAEPVQDYDPASTSKPPQTDQTEPNSNGDAELAGMSHAEPQAQPNEPNVNHSDHDTVHDYD